MNRKRKLLFMIVRSLVAILIALLVATVLIFISTPGAKGCYIYKNSSTETGEWEFVAEQTVD